MKRFKFILRIIAIVFFISPFVAFLIGYQNSGMLMVGMLGAIAFFFSFGIPTN